MGIAEYRYELRRGDEIVATGRLSREQRLEVGEQLTVGSRLGIVRAIEPILGEREQRLVVQLVREDVTTTVSFAIVPVPEIGRLAAELFEAGYVWRFNSSDWEAAFTKTIPSTDPLDVVNEEIREIMGDYYTEPSRTAEADT